ncbi:MAG: hypothetical protein AAB267_05130, partial [Candidatus Desantisbacteria bacterium]
MEGIPYSGSWQGVSFFIAAERKIYLKGTISGSEAKGIVEGYLTESVPESGIYDQYHATWKLGRLGGSAISVTLNLAGALSYATFQQYPSTQLHFLQIGLEGTTLGHYTQDLNLVLTNLKVTSQDSPYFGKGFSTISYTSKTGSGQGWTYDEAAAPGRIRLTGMFTSPLSGIVYGDLDETTSPQTLSLSIEKVDLGLPPAPDLKVKVWGPGRVSPGQTVTYIIEYRNDGVRAATDIALIDSVPLLTHFISASPLGTYDDILHIVRYNFESIPPKTVKYLNLRVEVFWGLPLGTSLIHEVNHYPKEEADIIFYHNSPRLTDEAQILLSVIFTAATTLLPSPLVELINLGVALPDMALFATILNVEKWRLEALNRCPRDPCGCNAANYFGAIRSLLVGLQGDPGYFKTRYPDKTFEEVIKEIANRENHCLPEGTTFIAPAHDPNIKYGPEGDVLPRQKLNYKIEYENEGEGIAFGVYFTDTLDEDLDDSTLEIGPVIDVNTGQKIGEPGTYNPETRTITWFVGEVGSRQGGYAEFSVNVKSDTPDSAEVINFATVYFPSVPEITRTNGIVNRVVTTVDNVPPTTTATLSPSANLAGWNNTEVTINLSATDKTDGSGVKEVHYKLTGAVTEERTISTDTIQ